MADVSVLPGQDSGRSRPSSMFPDGFSLTPLALRAHPDADLALIGFYTRLWEIAERRTRRIDGYGIRALAEAVRTPRSTTARYLERLVSMGFIYKEDRGSGRGHTASYILLPKLIEHPPTPPDKCPTETHLTEQMSHDGAPNSAKCPTDGTHLGSKCPIGGTHLTSTPLLIDRDQIEEQVRTSKMDRCKGCATAHRQLFDPTKFGNARKRFGREITAAAYVQMVFLVSHPTAGVPEAPWGLMYTIAKCYQLPARGECGLGDCLHGSAAIGNHRARRLDGHTTGSAVAERRSKDAPASQVAKMANGLIEQLSVAPPEDLDVRRQTLISQLLAMEETRP